MLVRKRGAVVQHDPDGVDSCNPAARKQENDDFAAPVAVDEHEREQRERHVPGAERADEGETLTGRDGRAENR